MRSSHGLFPAALLALLATASCSGASDSAGTLERPGSAGNSDRGSCAASNECAPGFYCNEFGSCSPLSTDAGAGAGGATHEETPPPEVELRIEEPAIGKRFVYVALPDQDAVARIDSSSLEVRTTAVGDDPGALRTIPGEDVALVINRGSASASVLRALPGGDDEVTTLPIVRGLNAIAVAPDGRHAVAFIDLRRAGGLSPSQPLQEVTLLRLGEGAVRAIDLAVGFRPSDVQFSADSSRAFIITERSVAVADLDAIDAQTFLPGVPLSRDALVEAPPQEVQITPDGARALVRIPGQPALRVVELGSGAITDLAFASEPTDVDLSPDGRRALVVLREAGEVLLIDLPEDIAHPEQITHISTGDHVAGQATLTPDGRTAFLFSNAVEQEVLMQLDLASAKLTVHPLKKGVRSVVPAPDGKTLVVLHNRVPSAPASDETLEEAIDHSFGYSLLDLGSGFTKLQTTPSDLGPLAFAPDGASAYLLLEPNGGAVRALELIDLRTFLVARESLGSPPLAVGVVPSTSQIYVAQEHPLGRVSFIDTASRAKRTITGFALNSSIIE